MIRNEPQKAVLVILLVVIVTEEWIRRQRCSWYAGKDEYGVVAPKPNEKKGTG